MKLSNDKLTDFICLICAAVFVWNAVILLSDIEWLVESAAATDLFLGFLAFCWAVMGWLDRYEEKRRGFNGPEEPDRPYQK